MSTTIKINTVTDPTALYHRYAGHAGPQPCFVELNCESGVLSADWDGEIGGAVPMAAYHHRTLRWGIPCLRADSANRLLAEIAPLAQRILDGYETVWDGSNHKGRLSEDASAAADAITVLCASINYDDPIGQVIIVWEAADYYLPIGITDADRAAELGITAQSTDDELADLGEELLEEAQADRHEPVDIIEGLDNYLAELRDALRDDE